MKIYHFGGAKSESERFFKESLVDYIKETGLDIPEAALCEGARVSKGPHGKPFFGDPALSGIYFSKSHTEGHELLCFSDSEIGIDCENTEARPGISERFMSIAERYFTEGEQAYIRAADGVTGRVQGEPMTRFFEIWTAKEAYMKYTGRGFSEGFRTFSTRDLPEVNIETGRLDEAPHIIYSVCREAGR